MASRLGWMTQHLASMQAMNSALTDLYAVLTPEQRGVADRLMDAMGPRGHGHAMAWQNR
jgi:Spy/CpxP family protein refolding chaperone